ncbi:MAG: type I restriction-modification system subunit M N-terminal domain-containing protein [Armatimonadetes bacterium]|nr:type I restriction-modification system subunit M N-terminal domain-containing protein [Armatimonadota bacterium]
MGALRLARTRTGGTEKARNRSALPFATGENGLDTSALCTWLWDAACAIRGAQDAPKFKDFILPLVFYKRLSDHRWASPPPQCSVRWSAPGHRLTHRAYPLRKRLTSSTSCSRRCWRN